MADENTPRDDWDARLRHLHAYWHARRGADGRPPSRSAIDPTDVPDLLRWIWLVDVVHDPIRFRFRLMGTVHVEQMRRDVTGHWIDEVFPGFLASGSYLSYIDAATRLVPSYRKGPAEYHVADYKIIERLILPLAEPGAPCNILLAITVYHEPLAGPAPKLWLPGTR